MAAAAGVGSPVPVAVQLAPPAESFWKERKVQVWTGVAVLAVITSVALAALCWPAVFGAMGALLTAHITLATLPIAAKIAIVSAPILLGLVAKVIHMQREAAAAEREARAQKDFTPLPVHLALAEAVNAGILDRDILERSDLDVFEKVMPAGLKIDIDEVIKLADKIKDGSLEENAESARTSPQYTAVRDYARLSLKLALTDAISDGLMNQSELELCLALPQFRSIISEEQRPKIKNEVLASLDGRNQNEREDAVRNNLFYRQVLERIPAISVRLALVEGIQAMEIQKAELELCLNLFDFQQLLPPGFDLNVGDLLEGAKKINKMKVRGSSSVTNSYQIAFSKVLGFNALRHYWNDSEFRGIPDKETIFKTALDLAPSEDIAQAIRVVYLSFLNDRDMFFRQKKEWTQIRNERLAEEGTGRKMTPSEADTFNPENFMKSQRDFLIRKLLKTDRFPGESFKDFKRVFEEGPIDRLLIGLRPAEAGAGSSE